MSTITLKVRGATVAFATFSEQEINRYGFTRLVLMCLKCAPHDYYGFPIWWSGIYCI